jgi:hypothetical protein
MANSEGEVMIDFGNVSPWLLPTRLDKLLTQKVAAAASTTPSDTAIPSDDGVTTDTSDPFDLNS